MRIALGLQRKSPGNSSLLHHSSCIDTWTHECNLPLTPPLGRAYLKSRFWIVTISIQHYLCDIPPCSQIHPCESQRRGDILVLQVFCRQPTHQTLSSCCTVGQHVSWWLGAMYFGHASALVLAGTCVPLVGWSQTPTSAYTFYPDGTFVFCQRGINLFGQIYPLHHQWRALHLLLFSS